MHFAVWYACHTEVMLQLLLPSPVLLYLIDLFYLDLLSLQGA